MTLLLYWKQLLAAGIALAALAFAYHLGGLGAEAKLADQRAKAEGLIAEAYRNETAAVKKMIQAERVANKAMAQVATNYEQGRADAQDDADRTIAELRAGNRKLRQHWEAATATASLSGAVATASGADGEAGLREEGIGSVLRTVGACQAHVIGLQEAVREYAK